jgi:hypothetical protein
MSYADRVCSSLNPLVADHTRQRFRCSSWYLKIWDLSNCWRAVRRQSGTARVACPGHVHARVRAPRQGGPEKVLRGRRQQPGAQARPVRGAGAGRPRAAGRGR